MVIRGGELVVILLIIAHISCTRGGTDSNAQKNSKPIIYNAPPRKDPEVKPVAFLSVKIGTQEWSTKNLNVFTFRNGDTILEAKTDKEWETAGNEGRPVW